MERFLTKKSFLAVAAILAIVFLIFFKNHFFASKTQYQTVKVERTTIVSSVSASGSVQSSNFTDIITSATGTVKKVFVKEGDSLNKGDKIAETTLNSLGEQKNSQAWGNYLAAKNSLDNANTGLYSLQSDMLTKWKNYMDLAQNPTYQNSNNTPRTDNRTLTQFVTIQDDWLSTEGKYKNQQGIIAQASVAVNNTWLSYQMSSPVITAPIAGKISNLAIVEGLNLSGTTTSQRVAVIKNEAPAIISVNLTEADVPKIKIDQKATVSFDSLPNKTFTGKIKTVDKIGTVNSNVTNYPALIVLDTQTPEILPNMSATVSIIIETKDNVLTIPSTAVQTQGQESIVQVLKNEQAQQVVVQTGLSSETGIEIVSGLQERDEVITGNVSQANNQSTRSVFGGGLGGTGAFRFGGGR